MEGSGLFSDLPKLPSNIHPGQIVQPALLWHCCGTGKDSFGLPLVLSLQILGPQRVRRVMRTGCTHCWPDSELHRAPGTADLRQASRGVFSDLFLWGNRENAQICHYTHFHPPESFRLSLLPGKEGPESTVVIPDMSLKISMTQAPVF